MGCVVPVYRPRDAEHTVLHQVIAQHLDAFLGAVAEAGDGAGLPQFVGPRLPAKQVGDRDIPWQQFRVVHDVDPWGPFPRRSSGGRADTATALAAASLLYRCPDQVGRPDRYLESVGLVRGSVP
jgi:hypothetical protein